MKRIFSVLSVLALAFLLSSVWASGSVQDSPQRLIESFTDYKVGSFPKRFRTYPFQRGKAKQVYRVASDSSNQFLRAYDDKDISVQVFRRFIWDVEKYPWIKWRWRARVLPAGGDERQRASNDSACGVYIVFGQYTGKILKYIWSTTVPVGTVYEKKPGKVHMIVRDSGSPTNPNEWRERVANVYEDYRRQFNVSKVKNPSGFGLLTDGNALHVAASCDYDDFSISSQRPGT